MTGLVVGEFLGTMDADRVRRWRARRAARGTPHPDTVAAAVRERLRDNPTTDSLALTVHAVGHGVVELTGTAPDEMAREIAGDLARGVPGADVVVNRVLVEGQDLPARTSRSSGTP